MDRCGLENGWMWLGNRWVNVVWENGWMDVILGMDRWMWFGEWMMDVVWGMDGSMWF